MSMFFQLFSIFFSILSPKGLPDALTLPMAGSAGAQNGRVSATG